MAESKFSKEQIEVLKQAFGKYDKNKDGLLAAEELDALLKGFGQKVKTQAELEYIYSSVGRSPKQGMTLDDFIKCAGDAIDSDNSFLQLRQAFGYFDKNGDGYITKTELLSTLRQMGIKGESSDTITEDEADAILRDCDINNDGRIDYEEFVRMMLMKME